MQISMSRFSLPFTHLIHENLSIVMTFAFSRGPLEKMIKETFVGEWKYLNKVLFSISEEHAEKACLELALFLRMLDEEQQISEYYAKTTSHEFGRLIFKDGSEKPLTLREVTNKIIHSSGLEWEFDDFLGALLVCHGSDKEKWEKARIEVQAVAAACGTLMS